MIWWVIVGAAASAVAAPNVLPTPAFVQYQIRADDTLIGLARKWFVQPQAWRAVQNLNHIADPQHLTIGKTIAIPRDMLRIQPIVGRVVAFHGPVTVAGLAPTIGGLVKEGMTIDTGIDASVTVSCSDGSRFSLPSQTRVGIARLRRVLLTGDLDRVFTTLRGRGEWQASHAPTRDSRFLVTTPVSVSAVRGTEFRVGFEEKATISVLGGLVGVGPVDASSEVSLPQGKGVAATAMGVSAPVDLLVAPKLLLSGEVQSEPTIRVSVRPVDGAASYVFELGTDTAMINRVAERRGSGPSVSFDGVADGRYFVRATATDVNGIDGFSQTGSLDRLQLVPLSPTIGPGRIDFRWTGEIVNGRDYRFALYRDAAATQVIVDRDGLAEPHFLVTGAPPAQYWWRAWAHDSRDGRSVMAVTDIQPVTIGDGGAGG